jgi:hypothetical protein
LTRSVTEACRLAGDIARRAERLIAAAPKLRAKGAGEAIDFDRIAAPFIASRTRRLSESRKVNFLHYCLRHTTLTRQTRSRTGRTPVERDEL